MVQLQSLFAILAATPLIQGHPGQSRNELFKELRERRDFIAKLENPNAAHCVTKLGKRSRDAVAERRGDLLKTLRRGRGLDEDVPHFIRSKRQIKQEGINMASIIDAAAILQKGGPLPLPVVKSHKSNLTIANARQADWTLLNTQNRSITLTPRIPEGPYYVSGEHIRKDLRDNEKGVELVLDIQFIDINNCQPINNLAVELYQSNATGVYSNVIDVVNGDLTEENLRKQSLRGIQFTGRDGGVQFQTIFPGQYGGRAQHTHVATHLGATVHPNNTISGGIIPHVGVIYFDEDLLSEVAKVPPYTANRNRQYANAGDVGVIMGTLGGSDPFLEYSLLSNDIKDGVLGWINMAIDTRVNASITAATTCTASGCQNSIFDSMNAAKSWASGLSAAWDKLMKGPAAWTT